MNLLDGLKVKHYGIDWIVVQTQIIQPSDNHKSAVFRLAIMRNDGKIDVVYSNEITFKAEDVHAIFNDPKKAIERVQELGPISRFDLMEME